MGVFGRKAEALGRLALEVEFDHDGRFLARDPGVMTWLDCNHSWGLVLERVAIGVLALDPAAGEKANVGVHA